MNLSFSDVLCCCMMKGMPLDRADEAILSLYMDRLERLIDEQETRLSIKIGREFPQPRDRSE